MTSEIHKSPPYLTKLSIHMTSEIHKSPPYLTKLSIHMTSEIHKSPPYLTMPVNTHDYRNTQISSLLNHAVDTHD